MLYALTVRALGIDYGKRRIGLALSDPTGLLARPWKAIESKGGPAQIAASIASHIAGLRADADGLDVVVVGLPRRLSGEPTEHTAVVRDLAARLAASVPGISVVLQDERLTSREAESQLARSERDWRRRKAMLDATAAAVILQDYLDGQASGRPAAEGPDR